MPPDSDALFPDSRKTEPVPTSGLGSIIGDWQAAAHPPGSSLSVSDPSGEKIRGDYQGLGDDGALRLRKADGTLIVLHAGDVEMDQRDIR